MTAPSVPRITVVIATYNSSPTLRCALLSLLAQDYTDFEGMKYDPEIGVYGMDVSVVLGRPGFRVKHRRLLRGPVSASHRIRRQEGMDFARQQFQVEVVD